MKRLLLLLTSLPLFSLAQPTCCSISSTEKFSQLAMNDKFASSHAAPLTFVFHAVNGKMVTYNAGDGKPTSSFQVNAHDKTDKWLIVFHEWWGLNDYIKKESEKLSQELNVNVIAVDLYDGYVAATKEEAQTKMSSMKEERTKAIIQGTFTHVGANAKIATLGWCMGGGWSMQASLMAGKQNVGCVIYYGQPETDVSKLKTLNGDVLGIFAKRDEWITPKVVETFEKNMKQAGKNLTVKSYDAVHAFANPSNPEHNNEAATDARANTITFLKGRFK